MATPDLLLKSCFKLEMSKCFFNNYSMISSFEKRRAKMDCIFKQILNFKEYFIIEIKDAGLQLRKKRFIYGLLRLFENH
jgi:hypothetical protein